MTGAAWTPTPQAQQKTAQEREDRDWDYWRFAVEPAVNFAIECVKVGQVTDKEIQQKILRDSLETIEDWMRED